MPFAGDFLTRLDDKREWFQTNAWRANGMWKRLGPVKGFLSVIHLLAIENPAGHLRWREYAGKKGLGGRHVSAF